MVGDSISWSAEISTQAEADFYFLYLASLLLNAHSTILQNGKGKILTLCYAHGMYIIQVLLHLVTNSILGFDRNRTNRMIFMHMYLYVCMHKIYYILINHTYIFIVRN